MNIIQPPGYEAARSRAAVFDVSSRGKIKAEGKEAVVFLHNLCSNDIKSLAPNTGCEAFFCTATAKVVAHGWIWRTPPDGKRETLWIDVPAGLHDKLYAHLDRYLISEDVTLTDHTADFAQLHLVGPEAVNPLRSAQLDPGEYQRGRSVSHEQVTVRCVDSLGLPGFDLLCPHAAKSSLLASLTADLGDEVAFDLLRIEGGVPIYGKDMDDNTFAPEVGRTTAISYNKGCYIGQEPIVMARDRGVVQRALVGLLAGEYTLPSGSLLYRDGKEVGRTATCASSPRLGQCLALAYVRRGSQQPGTELEADVAGSRHKVQVTGLPFVR